MRKVLSFSVAVIAIIFAGAALSFESATKGSQKTPHIPIMWKVSDKDNSIYLLGSFHLLKKGDYPLSEEIDRAFSDAETMMFEIDLASVASVESQAALKQYSVLDPGQKLSNILPKETTEKLEALFKKTGASLEQVESTAPWTLNIGMVLGLSQAMGYTADAGLDKHLSDRAKAEKKAMLPLETFATQIKALHDAPLSEQAVGVTEFVNNPVKVATGLNDLHAAWMKGDIAALDSKMRQEMERETPESYRLINVARNSAWLPQIQNRLDRHSANDDTLVVVGVMHLLGKDGLVEKLRAKGYTVERLCSTCEKGQSAKTF